MIPVILPNYFMQKASYMQAKLIADTIKYISPGSCSSVRPVESLLAGKDLATPPVFSWAPPPSERKKVELTHEQIIYHGLQTAVKTEIEATDFR